MNQSTQIFLDKFLANRKINVEFYKRVPEDKLDFRMIDTPQRKSDSIRESIVHQIYVTRNYIYAVKTGKMEWSDQIYEQLMDPKINEYSRDQLLEELNKTELELKELSNDPEIDHKQVIVNWSEKPVLAVTALYGLNDHEILHQGWNLAVMDYLNIERFPELKEMWG